MAILTPDQRLRVFVSSTMDELAPERAAVREVIERLRLSPVLFELGARPHAPRALYRAYLEQSHIFVGLYWERYGWIGPDMDVSGLEDELRLSQGLPRLLYIKEPAPNWEGRLASLIEQMTRDDGAQPRTFATAEQLADLVADDLAVLLSGRFTSGRDGAPAAPGQGHALAGAGPLPVPPTTFVGRGREIAEVASLLRRDDVRMVTLAGAGGIGKTRLALEVGRAVADDFPDGVHLILLASVPDPDLVIANVATGLGVRTDESGSVEQVVAQALGGRKVLLILDNVEQVVEAGPALGRLLELCPNLHLLVTSRRLLRISAEHEYQVPTLPVPQEGAERPEELEEYDAVRLFVERATAVRPDFRLTEADAPSVAELSRRLDGVPLAIELAAARSRVLPPAALLARLDRAVDVLAGGLADLPDRQRSLRATLDWSHSLLSDDEQRLLARLSTFAGGWTLEAAEAVCATTDGERFAILDGLAGLADNSLVVVRLSDGRPEARFRMLQPVREYARERLAAAGELEMVDAAHLAHFADLVSQAGPALLGSEQAAWLDRLEAEAGNLGAAAVRAAESGRDELLADMGWHLWVWLWLNHHVAEARHWLDPLVDRADSLPPLQRARLRWVVGSLLYEGGWYDEAAPHVNAALDGFTELGDDYGRGLALTIAGSIRRYHGDPEGARAYLAEAAEILRRHDDRFSAALAGGSLGMHWVPVDIQTAEPLLAEALADAESIGNDAMVCQLWLFQSFAAVTRGDTERAGQLLRAVVAASGGRRSDEVLAYGFDGLAALALLSGDAANAATLLGAAAGLRRRGGMSVWPGMRAIVDGLVEGAKSALGAEEHDIAWRAGESLSRDAARRFALDLAVPAGSGAAGGD